MNKLDEAVKRASGLTPLEIRLRDALRECQSVLELMAFPSRKGISVLHVWAQCRDAEMRARQALAEADRIEQDRKKVQPTAVQMVPIVGAVNEGER